MMNSKQTGKLLLNAARTQLRASNHLVNASATPAQMALLNNFSFQQVQTPSLFTNTSTRNFAKFYSKNRGSSDIQMKSYTIEEL